MDWSIWRPVLAGFGSLIEVQEQWSIVDLLDSHEVLDVKAEMEAADLKRVQRQRD